MAFQRSHLRQKKTCEEYKAELKKENYHLYSKLQTEVNSNRQNEKQIRKLKCKCVRCEQEIQTLNVEIERLENASKEKIAELKSEISSLKKQLYQAKKDICNNEKHISSIESQLVDSEEQVEKLRCQIRIISSRKNLPERGNSPDLYNSDDNMATIIELVNAIDGFVDNRATHIDIRLDQIKRTTRQICQKYNTLQQDLVRKQRRRYDAEAERDNEIIRRQLAEGVEQRAIADLHQLWTNARNQVNRMLDNITGKRTRIGVLVQEKFALQLLYQRNAHHLQRSRGDIGLLEFNRDRLYKRYEKWKNKTQAERQNILNLQGQILALQNNPPNQINMAGIPHPWFDWDDSIPDFLAQLRLDLHNRGIDPNDNVAGPPTGRDNAIGHLRGCMRGRTLEWFDDEITTKQNWELTNLLDNTGQANLVAVNGRTAIQIGVNALNEIVGQPENAIVKLRAVEDAWNEDWRIAGDHPTNASVNAPNANAGNTVVVAGIHFGQAIWWLKTHFPTVEEKLRDLMYGTIRKGDMTIDELYRKILRIGRQANYRPEELCKKFLDALPLPWLKKAKDISKHLPLAESFMR